MLLRSKVLNGLPLLPKPERRELGQNIFGALILFLEALLIPCLMLLFEIHFSSSSLLDLFKHVGIGILPRRNSILDNLVVLVGKLSDLVSSELLRSINIWIT